jgi:hypothetical protein
MNDNVPLISPETCVKQGRNQKALQIQDTTYDFVFDTFGENVNLPNVTIVKEYQKYENEENLK